MLPKPCQKLIDKYYIIYLNDRTTDKLYGGFAACGNPPNGRLKTHPIGGYTRTITYDAASRITNTADTNPIYNRSFDYDANNRLTRQLDNAGFENSLL